jgi:hypothetical protein
MNHALPPITVPLAARHLLGLMDPRSPERASVQKIAERIDVLVAAASGPQGSGERLLARFIPQVWEGDQLYTLPESQQLDFDVTDHLRAMAPASLRDLQDPSMRDHLWRESALAAIVGHDGPFEVELMGSALDMIEVS